MNKADLRQAHKYCTSNKNLLRNDSACGFFIQARLKDIFKIPMAQLFAPIVVLIP